MASSKGLDAPVELRHGDRIVIGPVELVFRVAAEAFTSTGPVR